MKTNKTIVVNLFGAPGSGKSTGAAYIFSKIKMLGVNAELVTEFAKDKVWEKNESAFQNQAYIFGEQSYRLSRCSEQVDVIVTDSPLPLSIIYNTDPLLTENFNKTVMDVFNGYMNLNYLLVRTKPYNATGRLQNEQESNDLAQSITDMLKDRNIVYTKLDGNTIGYDYIVKNITERLIEKYRDILRVSK